MVYVPITILYYGVVIRPDGFLYIHSRCIIYRMLFTARQANEPDAQSRHDSDRTRRPEITMCRLGGLAWPTFDARFVTAHVLKLRVEWESSLFHFGLKT